MKRALNWFGDWFASDAGTVQTLAVCLAIVMTEFTFPALDPHGFWLLYALTVYSAVTQPALARSGRVSQEALNEIITRIAAMEAAELRLLRGDHDRSAVD